MNDGIKLLLSMLDNSYKSYVLLNELYETIDKFYMLGFMNSSLSYELNKISASLEMCLQHFNEEPNILKYYERIYNL